MINPDNPASVLFGGAIEETLDEWLDDEYVYVDGRQWKAFRVSETRWALSEADNRENVEFYEVTIRVARHSG